MPLAESKRGRSTAILSEVAKRFGYKLEAFADGGIRAAVDAARSVTGNTYLWGGTGPTGFDCSGFMGWLQQILMGASPASAAGKRLYTTYSLLDGATSGLVRGAGPAGTAFVVGVSQEHMAGTLAGQPVESGGAHGTSRIGAPAVGRSTASSGPCSICRTNWSRVVSVPVSVALSLARSRSGRRRINWIWSLLVSRCSRRRNPATRCMGRRRSLTPTGSRRICRAACRVEGA
ncbi:hypothetical protein GS918_28150 [Rhodococcus hoagii]|nr:hypothetical protein [Prescottella equi]